MYLFSRQIRFGPGNTRDQMEWALAQTEKVNQITDLQVALYMQMYSPEVGAVGWSTFVPDLPSLEAAGDKLNTDDSFIAATTLVLDWDFITKNQQDFRFIVGLKLLPYP